LSFSAAIEYAMMASLPCCAESGLHSMRAVP
jgi:hypothetical protein